MLDAVWTGSRSGVAATATLATILTVLGACDPEEDRAPARVEVPAEPGGARNGGGSRTTGGSRQTGGAAATGGAASGGAGNGTGGAGTGGEDVPVGTTSAVWDSADACFADCGGDLGGTRWVMLGVCDDRGGPVSCWDESVPSNADPAPAVTPLGVLDFGDLEGDVGSLVFPSRTDSRFIYVATAGTCVTEQVNDDRALIGCPIASWLITAVNSCESDDNGACVCDSETYFQPPAFEEWRQTDAQTIEVRYPNGSDEWFEYGYCVQGDLLVLNEKSQPYGLIFGRAD